MRVQNEGTGKSSWWMLNPDAKPGKSVRRRAASMETSKFEKRRGRVKKRVEQLRNGQITSEFWCKGCDNWLCNGIGMDDFKMNNNGVGYPLHNFQSPSSVKCSLFTHIDLILKMYLVAWMKSTHHRAAVLAKVWICSRRVLCIGNYQL